MQNTAITNDNAALFVGAPVYSRNRQGYVTAIRERTAQTFMIGRNMRENHFDVDIAWCDGTFAELPDGMVNDYIEEAARCRMTPISEGEARDMLANAKAEKARQQDRARADAELTREAYKIFREDAARRLPAWAKAVIVAEHVTDDSDTMSDYFASKKGRTIILAFSKSTRDLFPELRNAALNHAETAHLATAPENAEHREKWSMGAGYYLKVGGRHSTGWQIRKLGLYDRGADNIPMGEWSLAEVAAPAPVQAPADEPDAPAAGMTIEKHIHTKKGFDMWVAVMSERVDRDTYDSLLDKARDFREWLESHNSYCEEIDAGAFKESGTGVATCLVVIDQ
ncbi:hypothetical protein HDIA_0726 [Hartmannibacter diazotrophicus]|uniref:Uncharacterized protein n=1 Tax=Hartmannibacter diazotrophicus TaxID=1482074 RepID=A0A2C9D1M1_9HYPH|nr:hypothetical protein [Hartmannibacter diazotrophicus]SON54267.1 hypothetical protein HDIA_0726 [Hartmannibacter diazotrophicus]